MFCNPNQAALLHAPTRRLGRNEQEAEIDQQQVSEVDQLHSMLYRLLNQCIEDIGQNAKQRQVRQIEVYQQQHQAQTQLKPSVKNIQTHARPLNPQHCKPYGYIALSQVLRNRASELHKIVLGYRSLPTATDALASSPSSSSNWSPMALALARRLPQKHSVSAVSVPPGLLTYAYEQSRLEFLLEASRRRFLLELNMVLSTLKQSHNPFENENEYEYGYKWLRDGPFHGLDFIREKLEAAGPGSTQSEDENDNSSNAQDVQIRQEVGIPPNIPLHPSFLAISDGMGYLLSFIREEAGYAQDELSMKLADAYHNAPHHLMIAWALSEVTRLDHGATNTQRYLWLQKRREACQQVWSEIKVHDLIEQDDPMYGWWQNIMYKWES